MRKPVLTIFYQFNPWQPTIGGIQTIIRSFVKYAPQEFDLRLVGTGVGSDATVGQWSDGELEGHQIQFMPLFNLEDDNVRKRIPTSVKYTLALLGRSFTSDFMHFHRLEPTLAALPWATDKTLFIHNDIAQQVQSAKDKAAILWQRFPKLYYAFEQLLVPQFTQIYSCNSNSAKLYQQRYPSLADRVNYIRNTVDNQVFYPLTAAERDRQRIALAHQFKLPETTRFLLFAGRLHPQKDPVLLVQAIAALNLPDIHLLIAGDGELSAAVQAEIQQLGLSEQVTLLGPVKQAQLADLHRISSAFVLSSAYEGLPLVVLEALACGTPIVTTRCGETPNLLTANSGVVCSERSPQSIADALRQVLLQPENFSAPSCIQAAEPFSARQVIHNVYTEMYQRWEMRALA
jgi:glycosyltransferase involved in cell wall biosynthesis